MSLTEGEGERQECIGRDRMERSVLEIEDIVCNVCNVCSICRVHNVLCTGCEIKRNSKAMGMI